MKTHGDRLTELQAVGKDPFQITRYDVVAHSIDIKDSYEQQEEKGAAITGRMMFKRITGEASFYNVQDLKGNIQVYVAGDSVGEEPYKDSKKMDVGDVVGVKEEASTTKTGKISIHVAEITFLSKSLQVFPEKFHSLTDTDVHYRQRYVDLTMNAEVRDALIKRSGVLIAIRKYLGGKDSMEVETPMLVSDAGGAVAESFEIHFSALDEDFKLRISLEPYPKRLTVDGLERVYEIGRVFRSEGLDTRHNSEFTLVELYQAYTDYNGMMDLTEKLCRFVAQKILGTTTITYKGMGVDLGKPSVHITMMDAIKRYAGVDFDQVHTLEETRTITKEKGVELERCHKKGDVLNLFLEEFAEEHLVQSTFILDHPARISLLAKKKPGSPDYVECFEFFMGGWKIANAYSEVNDPIDQREQSRAQEELLAQGDEEVNCTDEDLLNVLEVDMPPTGGTRFGIGHVIILPMNLPTIKGVPPFPTVKSLPSDKQENPSIYADSGTF